jgi:hypothetical protein
VTFTSPIRRSRRSASRLARALAAPSFPSSFRSSSALDQCDAELRVIVDRMTSGSPSGERVRPLRTRPKGV